MLKNCDCYAGGSYWTCYITSATVLAVPLVSVSSQVSGLGCLLLEIWCIYTCCQWMDFVYYYWLLKTISITAVLLILVLSLGMCLAPKFTV